MQGSYDIIVVGGGHAGCEAAMAAARMGSSVLLISMDDSWSGQLKGIPCLCIRTHFPFDRREQQHIHFRQQNAPQDDP